MKQVINVARTISELFKQMHQSGWKIIHCRAKQRALCLSPFTLSEKIELINQGNQQ